MGSGLQCQTEELVQDGQRERRSTVSGGEKLAGSLQRRNVFQLPPQPIRRVWKEAKSFREIYPLRNSNRERRDESCLWKSLGYVCVYFSFFLQVREDYVSLPWENPR